MLENLHPIFAEQKTDKNHDHNCQKEKDDPPIVPANESKIGNLIFDKSERDFRGPFAVGNYDPKEHCSY